MADLSGIGKLQTVTVVGDNTKRGGTPQPSSSGLFVTRLGHVTGTVTGTSLTITVEGGNPAWEGALSPNLAAQPYYTRAQRDTLASLKKLIERMSQASVVIPT